MFKKTALMIGAGLVLMIALLFGTADTEAFAATGNDTRETATVIEAGTEYAFKSESDKDEDWLVYTVTDNCGTETFSFFRNSLTSRWKVDIYEEVGKDLKQLYHDTPDSDIETVGYSFSEGTRIFFHIVPYYQAKEASYKVSVNFDPTPVEGSVWSPENNDSYKTAFALKSGQTVCGLLNYAEDEDWQVYTVEHSNATTTVSLSRVGEKGSWRYFIYKENGAALEEIEHGTYDSTYTTKGYSFGKGDKIYVKISGLVDCNNLFNLVTVTETVNTPAKPAKPYALLAGTNVIVGSAEPDAVVYVQYKNKKYHVTADSEGIYVIKTAKLSAGKTIKIWQKNDAGTSETTKYKITK